MLDLENAKAQMRKGILEMCVLAVIAQEESYPPLIMKKLERTELVVKEGTLYPLLVRLKNDGLVEYIWREGDKGPPRKYFTVTEAGRQVLQELTQSWDELVTAVSQTLEVHAGNGAPSFEGHTPTKPLNIEPLPPKDIDG